MERLGVAMLGALDEQGHEPDRERCNRMPIERRAVKGDPKDSVKGDN